MKTKSIISTTLALIASVNLISAPIYAEGAKSEIENPICPHIVEEISPCDIAAFMDNPCPNAFCDFRIVTNAEINYLTEVIVGNDIFVFDNCKTKNTYVLFNTRGTDDITDDFIIGIYESPIDDDSAELALYESIYNDMWFLR